MSETRVLLVDVLNPHVHSQLYGEALPFVQAWIAAAGLPVRLVALGLEEGRRAVPGEPPRLTEEDEEQLAAAIIAARATHVLANVPLPAAVLRRVRARGLDVVAVALGERFVEARAELVPWLCAWLALPEPEDEASRALLPDRVEPDYAVLPLNEAARANVTAVRVVAGRYAWHDLPIVRSPFFKPGQTDANYIARSDVPYPYRTPPVELALRQMAAARRTLPAERRTAEYTIHGPDVLLRVDDFAERAATAEPAGAVFIFSVEADVVLAAAAAIERALPRLRAAGQRLAIGNVGLPNFSRAECERMGAPVLPATYIAADDLLRGWSARFRDTFLCIRVGGFGVALYTPWTTLADLRENLAHVHLVDPRSTGYLTTTRLRIVPGTPVAARAAADGLLVDRSDPAVFGPGADEVGAPHERGLPWRFADRRVALVHTLATRMVPDEGQTWDDPTFAAAQKLRGALDDATREDPARTLALLVDVVAAAPDDGDVRGVLEGTLARIGKESLYIGLEEEPEPEDGTLRQPDDEPARDARRLEAWFAALPPDQLARLQGYRAESVVAEHNTEGHRVIAITLRFGEERLVTNLLPRRAVRGSFAFTTKYALCYHQDTPVDSREKELAVQALAEMVEAATMPEGGGEA